MMLHMGMFSIVYSRAIHEQLLIAVVPGYSDFNAALFSFLRDDEFKYQSIFVALNLSVFPFSDTIFPEGFFFGIDVIPVLSFKTNRDSDHTTTSLSLTPYQTLAE